MEIPIPCCVLEINSAGSRGVAHCCPQAVQQNPHNPVSMLKLAEIIRGKFSIGAGERTKHLLAVPLMNLRQYFFFKRHGATRYHDVT